MLQGLNSLTHMLTQREPFGTHRSGSGAPRTGTLNLKCHGSRMRLKCRRLREQINWISLCWNFHPILLAFIPCLLQPKMSRVHALRQPKSLTSCVVHHTLVVACDCHTRAGDAFSSLPVGWCCSPPPPPPPGWCCLWCCVPSPEKNVIQSNKYTK